MDSVLAGFVALLAGTCFLATPWVVLTDCHMLIKVGYVIAVEAALFCLFILNLVVA